MTDHILQNTTMTQPEALAILESLNDDPDNVEENELIEEHNPFFYGILLKLRAIAYGPVT